MALLNEINVKGVPHPIVTDDGYYSEMSVGDAEQLISSMYVEDSEPYGYRTTGGSADVGNREYIDAIVGGTVVWNQLINGNGRNPNVTYADGRFIVSNFSDTGTTVLNDYINLIMDHKYFMEASSKLNNCMLYVYTSDYKSAFLSIGSINKDSFSVSSIVECSDTSIYRMYLNRYGATEDTPATNYDGYFQLFDLTKMFGSTIADYIYSLEQSQAGAGVAWFKKLFPKDYYPYNAGELLSVEGLQSHDTVGFNQWDEEWEVGVFNNNGEPYGVATNAIRSKTFCKCVPNTTYYCRSSKTGSEYYIQVLYYDANKNFISRSYVNNRTFTTPQNAHYFKICTQTSSYIYGGTYINDICINLSDPSRNGEYEPYEKHSYPLDSSLTLRGIPKLDASNNLYYDGDEYTSDGTVKRKYGIVDLGTLDWGQNATSRFYATLPNKASINTSYDDYTNVMCANYESKTLNQIYASNKGISTHPLQGTDVWIYDSDYTDGNALRQALQGVMLVYELATPTTETAEPFKNIQIVDDFGTEELVSTGIVPVGHKTRYPANLRDKLQHLPSLASADGTYLIQQSGKQMSLIHMPAVFPEIPIEDGTYVLKATVSGGTPTYVWEGVNTESEGE